MVLYKLHHAENTRKHKIRQVKYVPRLRADTVDYSLALHPSPYRIAVTWLILGISTSGLT